LFNDVPRELPAKASILGVAMVESS